MLLPLTLNLAHSIPDRPDRASTSLLNLTASSIRLVALKVREDESLLRILA